MFDNNNSDNGQRRLRFNFGKKFKRKPYNHELSYQENMMNLINDYRQWQQDNPQPDCSNMSTREVLEAIVSDFRAQQREEEEAKKAAQMQTPYGSGQTILCADTGLLRNAAECEYVTAAFLCAGRSGNLRRNRTNRCGISRHRQDARKRLAKYRPQCRLYVNGGKARIILWLV